MKTHLALCLSLFLLLIITGGCLSKPNPHKNAYAFSVGQSLEQGDSKAKKSVVIGRVGSSAGYETRKLIYKVASNQFEKDFYNEWVSPPDRLIADRLALYVSGNSKYKVEKGPAFGNPVFGLDIQLEGIYGDYSTERPSAELAVKISLFSLKGKEKRLLDKTYHRSQEFYGNEPGDLVKALDKALAAILDDFCRDLNSLK